LIIGFNTIGDFINDTNLPSSIDNNFYSVELKNVVADEIYISKTGDIINASKTDWVIDTYLKAMFKNDLEGGNVSLGGLEIDRWKVRRREIESMIFKEIATVTTAIDGNFYYLDTSPKTDVIYEYEVIPMSGNIEGFPHIIQIKISFKTWWLADGEEAYPFFANIEIGDINNNKQRHEYLGFNQYPTISYGNAKYKSSTITAMLLDSFLKTNINYRKKVEDFINNEKTKYLKSPYGDVWLVDTHSSKRTQHLGIPQELSTISFDWVEVGEAL
jgi:hypothetical protein